MPQLLHYVNVESLTDDGVDFATLVVFTCSASCDIGAEHVDEFVFRQNFVAVEE